MTSENVKISAAIITASDSRSIDDDVSGDILKALLEEHGAEVIDHSVLPDDLESIRTKLIAVTNRSDAGFVSLFFSWRMPHGWDWLWLFLIGIFSQLGQIFLTNALQREKAAGVAIINYSGLIYAIFFGVIVFGEAIFPVTLLGMLLVVAGVVLSIIYSKRQDRRLAELDVTQA